MYKWSIEMWRKDAWVTEIRYYFEAKTTKDFDLCNVPEKRRNAKLLI
jgi:hypothetical protein